ncbi:unnamed protein product, partial [Porites evermanni]
LSSEKPYQRQKSTLEGQLISFLIALTTLKSIPQVHPRILLNFLLVEIGQAEQSFTRRHVIGNCVSAPPDWQPVLLTPSLGSCTLFIIGWAASILQTLSRIRWDRTFFVVDFFTGDKASDLGWLSCNQVLRLKDQRLWNIVVWHF